MIAIELVAVFEASAIRLWAELIDFRSHPEWMRDAASVEIETDQTSGVGTRFLVRTRVGPLQTTDLMTVTEWEEFRILVVRHEGAVSGVGRFQLRAMGSGTELRWIETLTFPWLLGGAVGAILARPVLKRVWRANLERLRERLEVSDP